MKKITLFAFAVAALSVASCKKARTCTCTNTQSTVYTNNYGATPNSPSTSSYSDVDVSTTKLSKGTAKAWCTSAKTVSTNETVQNINGNSNTSTTTSDRSCTVK